MSRTRPHQRRPAEPSVSGLTVDFLQLSGRADKLFRVGLLALVALALGGAVSVGAKNPQWFIAYIAMAVPSTALFFAWMNQSKRGLPLLPLFAVQHLVIYALPLVVSNPTIAMCQPATVSAAGLAVLLFLAACGAGWAIGKSFVQSKGSRWNLRLAEGRAASSRCMSLSFLLLGASLAFHLSSRTGLIHLVLAGPLEGIFPIVRTFSEAASMLGGMLGAMVVGGRPGHVQSWVFWLLVTLIGLLSIADVLISGASGLVIAVTIGLSFGTKRLPWRFLLVTFGLIGFLNQGKFVVRERYWNSESSSTALGLLELPGLYVEWAAASSSFLWGDVPLSSDPSPQSGGKEDDEGQSIFDRINNLHNLTYVLDVMEGMKIQPLSGETYTLIPKLLIPRFVWKDKPKAHEGQILLNLHFGRQLSVEQTEKTYIAWGLLPEAVGNFGSWLGPLLVGGVLGLAMGLLEQWSLRVRLFSVEGIVSVAFLLRFATSYEMVASVFVTSTFQFLVVSTVGGFFLYYWFDGGRQRNAARLRTSSIATGTSRFAKLSRNPGDRFDHGGD